MIVKALLKIRPNAEWILGGDTYDGLQWLDTTQTKPTEEEINQELMSLQKEYDYTEYQRLRKTEYDKLNQDELRFNDLVNGTTTWLDAINAIKAKYPKGE